MIADQEATRVRSLRTILASLGVKAGDIEVVENGELALSSLKQKNFHASFINLDLPKKSGMEILQDVRSSSQLQAHAMIVYSVETTKEKILEAVKAGATAFLTYPWSASDVESVLEQAFPKMK